VLVPLTGTRSSGGSRRRSKRAALRVEALSPIPGRALTVVTLARTPPAPATPRLGQRLVAGLVAESRLPGPARSSSRAATTVPTGRIWLFARPGTTEAEARRQLPALGLDFVGWLAPGAPSRSGAARSCPTWWRSPSGSRGRTASTRSPS